MSSVERLVLTLQHLFTAVAEEAPRVSGCHQRTSSKFSGATLCQTLVFGGLEQPVRRLRSWCQAAAGLGIRVSPQVVDWERRRAAIRRTLHWETLRGCVAGPKKNKRDRVVSLRPQTVAALEGHKAAQDGMRSQAGECPQEQGLVLTTDVGNPIGQRHLQRLFDRACQRAGLQRRTLKEMRHTFATLALLHNVPVNVVQEPSAIPPRRSRRTFTAT